LLLYLNCWYWEWVTYLIDRQVLNLNDSEKELRNAIHCMIHASAESTLTEYINESLLFQITMKESSKTYHISDIDEENKYGFFLPYKELVGKVSGIIDRVNPNYPYAKSLASTIFQMINNQIYYARHLPELTSLKKKNTSKDLEKMINHFAFGAIHYQS